MSKQCPTVTQIVTEEYNNITIALNLHDSVTRSNHRLNYLETTDHINEGQRLRAKKEVLGKLLYKIITESDKEDCK